ncbi:hypothetical protein GGI35DRAFT_463078 [Trichoderma velutinum]
MHSERSEKAYIHSSRPLLSPCSTLLPYPLALSCSRPCPRRFLAHPSLPFMTIDVVTPTFFSPRWRNGRKEDNLLGLCSSNQGERNGVACCICGGAVPLDHVDLLKRYPELMAHIDRTHKDLAMERVPSRPARTINPVVRQEAGLATAASLIAGVIEMDEKA